MTQGLKKSALFAASLFVTGALATVPFATADEAPASSAPSAPTTSAGSEDSSSDTGGDKISADRTIDLLVLYTGDAEEEQGGETQIVDAIQESVEGMNRALDRSDIEGKVNLVHAEKVDYQETDDQGDAMTWAREDDGALKLREDHNADLVSVVVSGAAGIGQAPIPNENTSDSAYSVVGADWLRPDDDAGEAGVFAHELGHNLGAGHDWDSDPGRNEDRPYNKGFVSEKGNVDIMAYNTAASCDPNCQRVPYYSNPDLTVDGEQFGTDEGDRPSNLKKLFDETIPFVSDYR